MKEERFPAWLHEYDSELYVRCRRCGTWRDISFELAFPEAYKATLEEPRFYKCSNPKCGNMIKVDRVYFVRKRMKKPWI